MITLFCTRRLVRYLSVSTTEDPLPSTTVLGDWHANLVATWSGDLIVFSNNRTLVSVAIPTHSDTDFETMLIMRVGNLLGMIGVDPRLIQLELGGIPPIQYARAQDRSQLGFLRRIEDQYIAISESHDKAQPLSLSDAELAVSNMPHIAGPVSNSISELKKRFNLANSSCGDPGGIVEN